MSTGVNVGGWLDSSEVDMLCSAPPASPTVPPVPTKPLIPKLA